MTTKERRLLGDQVRDYYLASSLPEERVKVILSQGVEAKSSSDRQRWILGIAATLVVVLTGGLLLSSLGDLGRTVAAEAIANYKKGHRKLIHVTDRYEELERALFELEFSLSDLATVIPPDLDLEGGRYCSLQGQRSALLRLRRKSDGQTGILYVAPRGGNLAHLETKTVEVGDFEVDLWHDRTRVFALTFEPASYESGSVMDPHDQPA